MPATSEVSTLHSVTLECTFCRGSNALCSSRIIVSYFRCPNCNYHYERKWCCALGTKDCPDCDQEGNVSYGFATYRRQD